MVQFTQYVAVQWSEMEFKSSMKTHQNHFDLKCKMIVDDIIKLKETNLLLEWWTVYRIQTLFILEKLPYKKEEDCKYLR